MSASQGLAPAATLFAGDVECIERATVAAVAPPLVEEIPGWLLAFDRGTIGRAHSAVPLAHDASVRADDVPAIVARYRQQGLAPSFRMADVSGLAAVHEALRRAGCQPTQPTLTMVADVQAMLERCAAMAVPRASLSDTPDDIWARVYLGEGFDPVDGAHRVKAFGRAAGSLYARSFDAQGTRIVATGVGSFGFGWMGVHGMRTLPAQRGQGHASGVLRALAQAAAAQGVARAYLQVEQDNIGAQAVYRRLGFGEAWVYHYWRARS